MQGIQREDVQLWESVPVCTAALTPGAAARRCPDVPQRRAAGVSTAEWTSAGLLRLFDFSEEPCGADKSVETGTALQPSLLHFRAETPRTNVLQLSLFPPNTSSRPRQNVLQTHHLLAWQR